MRALTVEPGRADSARLEKVPEPPLEDGSVLVRTLGIGICGTDIEIVSGAYGASPEGRSRLILGHESLGRVEAAPMDCGFAAGDLVVGIVRRPDPEPCRYCAAGEWDMCANGRYVERGIKGLDGYGSDYFRIAPEFAVPVDPALGMAGVLLEPASIVTKAWEHAERIGQRSAAWRPRSVLVTGAGPIGLLAALLGVQRGLEVHVMDRAEAGPKPQLVKDLGATYHVGALPGPDACRPDMVFECTGAPSLVLDVLRRNGSPGIVCLAGLSSGRHVLSLDVAALDRSMVLENDVVFGAVNANRSHYEKAAAALGAADRSWLDRLISRRVAPEHWADALRKQPHDVKVVLDFTL